MPGTTTMAVRDGEPVALLAVLKGLRRAGAVRAAVVQQGLREIASVPVGEKLQPTIHRRKPRVVNLAHNAPLRRPVTESRAKPTAAIHSPTNSRRPLSRRVCVPNVGGAPVRDLPANTHRLPLPSRMQASPE